MNDIKTNPDFWDCECEHNYIHSKEDDDICLHCCALEEDMPDSRQNEIEQILKDYPKDKKDDIIHQLGKALDWSMSDYSWTQLIGDTDIKGFDKEWAIWHTSYKVVEVD